MTYFNRISSNWFIYILFMLLFLMSVVFGLAAVSANPVIIGLCIGIVFGPILLVRPEYIIWIILLVLLLFGILSANPEFSKLTWATSLLSFLLFIPCFIATVGNRKANTPLFIKIALVFMIYCFIASIVQLNPMSELIAGFKRYFQMYGVMFSLVTIVFLPNYYLQWRYFLMIIAVLQLPFALFELLVLVPLRGGLDLSSETTDVVAGTFGANLVGGSPNSVMALFLLIIIAFLISYWRSGILSASRFFLLTITCLAPLGLGETKIVIVMLPLLLLVLLKKDIIRSPIKYFPAVLLIALLTIGVGYIYVVILMHSTFDQVIVSTIRYNFGDQGYDALSAYSVNRLTALTFWYSQQSWSDPFGFLFGNGLGSSYSTMGQNMGQNMGHLGLRYFRYNINLTAASTLLWDSGIVGLLLFVSVFIAAWSAAATLASRSDDPFVKAEALAIQGAIALFLLSIVYSDTMVNLASMELIIALILGYLGYLMTQHNQLKRESC